MSAVVALFIAAAACLWDWLGLRPYPSSGFQEVPISEAVKRFPEYFVVSLVGFTILFWWWDRS
jgi:hypothetical protein